MNRIPAVAAVEVGADGTRLVVPGPDGRPEPVAVLPPGTDAAAALGALVGDSVCDVVLVVPPGVDDVVGPPGRVHRLPAPVAVLAGRARSRVAGAVGGSRLAADPEPAAGPGAVRLVVDAGRTGVSLSVVDGGRVRMTETYPVGGDRLDELVASATGLPPTRARTVREALSFVERVEVPGHGSIEAARVEAVLGSTWDRLVDRAEVLADGVDEVVLTGGLARTPLLAALIDGRVACPVRVLPEPDLAAVRGALRWMQDGPADGRSDSGGERCDGRAARCVGRVGCADRLGCVDRAGDVDRVEGGAVRIERAVSDASSGDRVARRRELRTRYGVQATVVALGVVLVGTGTALGAAPEAPAVPQGALVQFGYATVMPAGWEHTGGDPEHRRTLLTRVGSPDGVELISVERSPLGYDGTAEPDRARSDLVAAFRRVDGVRDLRPDTVAGRPLERYSQPAGPTAVVDWFVLFDGTDQLVVGCRRPVRAPAPAVDRACADVVGSVRAQPPH